MDKFFVPFLLLAPMTATSLASPVAEFQETEQVLATDLLLEDYAATDFIRAILSARSKVHLVSKEHKSPKAFSKWLRSYGFNPSEIEQISISNLAFDSPWLRDYAPIIGRQNSFFSEKILFYDFEVDSGTKADNRFSKALAKEMGVKNASLNEVLHGGNFLSNGDICFLADANYKLRDSLKEKLKCREVVSIDQAPHPHIDMWAKIVDRRTVLVSELAKETLDLLRQEKGFVSFEEEELKKSLDRAADAFAQHLKVVRIPMPLPYRNTFRNYTNALIVNKTIIVPSYKVLGWNYDRYPDEKLNSFYEKTAEKIMKELGFIPRFVNADALIFGGGAFHCVAIQIPRPEKFRGIAKYLNFFKNNHL